MSTSAAWTDDRVQLLTRLWLSGLSASQIARALGAGATRNAVIGKVHRLGLGGRAKPSAPGPRPRRKLRARIQRPMARRPSPACPSPPTNEPLAAGGTATILSVRRGQCRWPIGDPASPEFSICGAPAARGAYCASHAQVAYRPLAKKPPRDHLLKLAGLA